MARRCDVCSKGPVSGHSISHADNKNKRRWLPNIQKVKAIVDGSPKRVSVCTRCLRSGKVKRAI